MKTINLTPDEKNKIENTEISNEELTGAFLNTGNEEISNDKLFSGNILNTENKDLQNSLNQAHERVKQSYSSYLKRKMNEEKKESEEDVPKYVQLKNPTDGIKPVNRLPEDDPFKSTEEDKSLPSIGTNRLNVDIYANPYTYKGGIPGFLPNIEDLFMKPI